MVNIYARFRRVHRHYPSKTLLGLPRYTYKHIETFETDLSNSSTVTNEQNQLNESYHTLLSAFESYEIRFDEVFK